MKPADFVNEKRLQKDFESLSELSRDPDSQHLANYGIPTGMIFVPSKNGISHSPEEHTEMRHIATAARILVTALTEAQNT